ncbi:hypothetical protein [Rahnella laticis]|uniref:hypothetical protein n=1 Tax=Rahnella laticis TaxID=2787622 RepID=UPI0018A2CBC0|nr:hypothetical protein [Rahnella laticis]MBF7997758.1 hypothetical protein [Rahnella laticis]
MSTLKNTINILYLVLSIALCIASWPLVTKMSAAQMQPIASAISTFSGILFGFVMASVTLIASAKDNTLIKNLAKTGYLKKLAERMHSTMGWLLGVCFAFIVILFFPDSLKFKIPFSSSSTEYLYSQIVLELGIFLLLITFKKFYHTWKEFKEITKLM